MDYHYKCNMRTRKGTESWTAGIDILKVTKTGQYEAEIEGRGTYFHVIAGRHKYGNFLCIPNFNVCYDCNSPLNIQTKISKRKHNFQRGKSAENSWKIFLK